MPSILSILLLFASLLPATSIASVVFTYASTCNDDAPFVSGSNGDCAGFGLAETDTVSGSFTISLDDYTPGMGVSLDSSEYDFMFEFGNEIFTEGDASSAVPLGFVVSNTGLTLSSMAGIFINANGAQLSLLTPSTVRVVLNSLGADTFGEGGSWQTQGPVVPLPPAVWLFASALISIAGIRQSRRSACVVNEG